MLIDGVGVMRWFSVRQRCCRRGAADVSCQNVNLGAKLKALDELVSFRANAIATELAGLYFPQLTAATLLSRDCLPIFAIFT